MLCEATIIGHLGKAPKRIITQTETPMAGFTVATNRKQDGEDITLWFDVVLFRALAETALSSSLTVGSLVYVRGRLELREWQDSEGQKRASLQIIASTLRMLSPAAPAEPPVAAADEPEPSAA